MVARGVVEVDVPGSGNRNNGPRSNNGSILQFSAETELGNVSTASPAPTLLTGDGGETSRALPRPSRDATPGADLMYVMLYYL